VKSFDETGFFLELSKKVGTYATGMKDEGGRMKGGSIENAR
jgi:hypothetical protein